MKRGILTLAVCLALLGIFVLGKWVGMYDETGSFNQFTVFLNDLSDTEPPSIDWCFFRNWDFPTGKCERVFVDVPMVWIGLSLVGMGGLLAFGAFVARHSFTPRPMVAFN